MSSLFWLCILTSAGMGWLVHRGTGNYFKAFLAGIFTFGLVTVVPLFAIAVLFYLSGIDWRTDGFDGYGAPAIVLGNLAVWIWALLSSAGSFGRQ